MRIGIDIDETLTDTDKSFRYISKKYNICTNKNFKIKWNEEELLKYSKYLSEVFKCAKLKEGVKESIDELHRLGHELYIITARNNKYCADVEDLTINMFKENNLCFDKIYFNQQLKSDIAKELGISLMIDDSVSVYNNMKEENIECIMFGKDVKSWREVLEYINKVGE